MVKRALSLMLVLMLFMIPTAFSQPLEADGVNALTPLLDAVASAAQLNGLTAITLGEAQNDRFVYTTMLYYLRWQFSQNQITPDAYGQYALDQSQLEALYAGLFATGHFNLNQEDCCAMITPADNGMSFDLATAGLNTVGTAPMLANASGDIENGVVVTCELYRVTVQNEGANADADWFGMAEFTLMADDTAPFGYTLVAYRQEQDTAMDETDDSLITYYANPDLGLSVYYPTLFAPYLEADSQGIAAGLPDGTASFYVTRQENTDNITLTQWADRQASLYPLGQVNLYDASQYLSCAYEDGGQCTYVITYVTEDYLYTVSFTYNADLEAQMAIYTEYFENSFSIDEIAVG